MRTLLGICSVVVVPSLSAQSQPTPSQPTQSLRLARPFGDGAVLQRGAPIPVWGWAAPRTAVTVAFRGATRRATADATGRWSVSFPAAPAGGPYTIAADGAGTHITVRDVLVGDVWVASGQSNMEMTVAASANAAAEIAAAHDSLVREYKIPIAWSVTPLDDVGGGRWAPADPAHVGGFSGVAYYFARALRASTGVPIGIVNSTWGGSAIETWISADAQGMSPDGPDRALGAERARLDSTRATLVARLGNVAAKDPGMTGTAAPWADPALDDASWKPIRVPAQWETQGYEGLDGVAWYRTTFTLTAEEAARGAALSLGPIDDDDVTWVNGVQVGQTRGYNVPRRYAVPPSALKAGVNVLAVRVADGGGGGGIDGTPNDVGLEIGGATRSLAGTWKFRVGEVGMQLDGQRINKVPAITYNAMVRPLLPMPIAGVIWYQGESNANNDAQARAYRAQFATLITSWRREWIGANGGTFPFLWVQLPNFGRPDSVPSASGGGWALQRASMDAALALPKTGQAIAIDVGGADELHPKNKQDVGARLALVARRVAYGEKVEASGPTYKSQAVRDGRMVITFDHAAGLTARGADGHVGAFAIAGADHRFAWAEARVEGDRVIVWSDAVPNPIAARYAWSNSPVNANLYNGAGLPAAPFRTDDWTP